MLKFRIRAVEFNDGTFLYAPEYKGWFLWHRFHEANEDVVSFESEDEAAGFLDIQIGSRIAHSYTVPYPGKIL